MDNLVCEMTSAHHTAFYSNDRQNVSPYRLMNVHVRSLLLEDLTTDGEICVACVEYLPRVSVGELS